jgi:hypothetical protein
MAEVESKSRVKWPSHTPELDPTGRGIVGVMDEEMGWEADAFGRLD